MGVDPEPLTLPELAWMAEGRDRADKRLLAEQMAYTAMMKGAKRARADSFDPYARTTAAPAERRPDLGWKDFMHVLKERVNKHGGKVRH